MSAPRLLLPVLFALATPLAALAAQAMTGSVEGMITYQGKPLAEGKVLFHPDKGKPVKVKIGKDGSYKAKKVPVGKLRVTVEAKGLPKKFANPKTSSIVVDVKVGRNLHDLNLKD